jgi:hypothetical protein
MCPFKISLNLASTEYKGLFSSNLSNISRTSLHCLSWILNFANPLDHLLRILLRSLNFVDSLEARLLALTSMFQVVLRMFMKLGCSN